MLSMGRFSDVLRVLRFDGVTKCVRVFNCGRRRGGETRCVV